jgi:hypothetical protein
VLAVVSKRFFLHFNTAGEIKGTVQEYCWFFEGCKKHAFILARTWFDVASANDHS